MLAKLNNPLKTPISTPLIFLPGTLCDERIWFPIWQQMNIENRAFAPLQWAESLEQMVGLTQDRIDSAEEPVHLVGFSMGGYIASLVALAPQNMSKIASLNLIAYNPFGLSQAETIARKGLLNTLQKKPALSLGKTRLAQYFTPKELLNNNYVQALLDMEADLGSGVLKAHIVATTPRQDLSKALTDLPISQYWFAGALDTIADYSAIERYTKRCKFAHLTRLDDTAHMLPLTRATELAEHLNLRLNSVDRQ